MGNSPQKLRPGEFMDSLRKDLKELGLSPSERTLRRWRVYAYVPQRPLYSMKDYNDVLLFAQIFQAEGSVAIAQNKFIEMKEQGSDESGISDQDSYKATVDTTFRHVA